MRFWTVVTERRLWVEMLKQVEMDAGKDARSSPTIIVRQLLIRFKTVSFAADALFSPVPCLHLHTGPAGVELLVAGNARVRRKSGLKVWSPPQVPTGDR